MSITRIGSATGVTSATLPAHQAGDLIVAFAYRDGSNTAPALPSGWTGLQSGGGSTNAGRLAYKIAASSAESATGFTNATSLIVVVYRATGTIGIGASAQNGGSSTSVAYPALTLTGSAGNSWVIGFAGHRSTNTALETAPSGMVNFASVADATDEAAGHDTNGTVSSWTAQSVSVGGTSSGWRAVAVEITEVPPAGGGGGGAITYSAPQTFAPADATAVSVTVDTGAAEAGRIVVLAIAGSNPSAVSFASGSFGGEAALLLDASASGGDDELFFVGAVVPSGTGNQTCSVTFTGGLFNLAVAAWVIRGAEFPETSSGVVVDPDFPYAPVVPLTIAEGGAVFAAAAINAGTSGDLNIGATPMVRTIQTNSAATRDVHFGDVTDLAAGAADFTQTTSLAFTAGAVAFTPAAAAGGDITGSLTAQETGADSASASVDVAVAGTVAAQESGTDVAAIQAGSGRSVSMAAVEAGSDVAAFSGLVGGVSVTQYYYLNSLADHVTGAWTPSTRLTNWMARLAASAGNIYSVDAEFGFIDSWSLPPDAAIGYEDAASSPLVGGTWTGAGSINRLSFVPDNFEGVTADPDALNGIATVNSYQDGITLLIDTWESNAPNAERVYTVYSGWPDMGPYGDPETITASNLLAWQTWALGGYQDWMELLVNRLQGERPTLDIRLSDINRVLMLTYQNTVVSTIAAGDLFEDNAPHGRASWYFLAALVEYMEAYGEQPPAGYVPDAGFNVHPTITSNYEAIVDYMWAQLTAAPGITVAMTAQETGADSASASVDVAVAVAVAAQESGSDQADASVAVVIATTIGGQEAGSDGAAVAASVDIGIAILAQESGADQAAASASVAVGSALAVQEAGPDGASGSATVAVAGALTAQEAGSDAAAVSGVVALSGALAAQESGADRAVIQAGSGRIVALSAQETGSDQAAGSVAVAVEAELDAQELGGDIASVIVSIEDNVITVNLAARETGPDVGSGAASVTVSTTAFVQEQGADGAEIFSHVVILASVALGETGTDRASIVVQNSVLIPSARRAATPSQSANGGRLTVTANGGRVIQSRNGGRLV